MRGLGLKDNVVTIVHSARVPAKDITSATERYYPVQCVSLEAHDLAERPGSVIVVDCDLAEPATVERLRDMLGGVEDKSILFVTPNADRAQFVQASALGADDVVPRPIAKGRYLKALKALVDRIDAPITEGLKAGTAALRAVFGLISGGSQSTPDSILRCGAPMAGSVAEIGLDRWVEAVNSHHSATYQHCLLVSGTAVAFGHHLGFRKRDIDRLLLGSLVHDLGKVAIPTEILEKPGALDEAEIALIRTHPEIGRDMLARHGRFDREMLDVVGHHHEYLDGSGYPFGLTAPDLPDIVRVITIADIFAALVETRPYRLKTPTPAEAYDVLLSMHGRLDLALVRAFAPVAKGLSKAA